MELDKDYPEVMRKLPGSYAEVFLRVG